MRLRGIPGLLEFSSLALRASVSGGGKPQASGIELMENAENHGGAVRRRGVIAVVVREGRLLVIRRAQCVVAPGAICFPGGGIEPGELDASGSIVANPAEVESVHWLRPDELLQHPELLSSNREFLEAVLRGEIELEAAGD
jgi:hypothetical protein